MVIDFTSHIIKNRDVGRKNAILDDSTDEFSFSNQGHNTFDIPIPTSSHLLKGIDSDNDNAIREDDTGINTDTKGASSKHEKFSVNSEEDLNFSEGKLTGRDSSTNILIRTQIVDQNLGDIDRDKVPNGGSPEVPKTHELIRDNSEKREAQNGNFDIKKIQLYGNLQIYYILIKVVIIPVILPQYPKRNKGEAIAKHPVFPLIFILNQGKLARTKKPINKWKSCSNRKKIR